jgi:penicillin G amidase
MPDLNEILGSLAAPFLELISRTPQLEGEIRLPEISAPVEIQRDRWGIPHIFAQNVTDLLAAQGYVHAQERLFQMEFNRRLVAGRLSELLGEVSLPVDRWMRTLTLRRVAEFEASQLSQVSRPMLEAYARGVNACLRQEPRPVEMTLLRTAPEPWTPADSLSWAKMMAWVLSVNWETELLRARLIERLGPEQAAELDPDYKPGLPVILPPGVQMMANAQQALDAAQAAKPFSGPSPYEGVGSNNWVLHGERTTSGKPLLANDMHLLMTIPAIWYENHLECPEFQATGVSFPGIPGIMAGHNGHVAWGFTNGFPDVQDLFQEHTRRSPEGSVEVEYQGAWEPARLIQEVIRVKDQPSITHEVVVTRHGPLVNNLSPELAGETPLALCWTALEPNQMLDVLPELLSAKNCIEFHSALQKWHTPAQNVVYADVEGSIGYTLAGRVPVRAKGDGQVPVPGWSGEYDWVGYIPFDEMPHVINPPQGYIATANNRMVDENYPHYLGRETISGDRAQRIVELIESQPVISPEFIQQMQFDQECPSARRLAKVISRLELDDPELQSVVVLMREWEATLDSGSPAAALYEVVYRRAIALLLSDRLDEYVVRGQSNGNQTLEATRTDLTERYLGKGPTPLLMEGSIYGFRALEWLLDLLETQEESPWYDLGAGQKREDILAAALADSIAYLKIKCGPKISDWAWGKLHQLQFSHTLSAVPALKPFFNRGPFPLGGDHNTVWATGTYLHKAQGDQVVGPPYRMIIDLNDLGNSRAILTPGQSGRPDSEHYDDQIEDWFAGNYHPMLFLAEQLAAEPLQVLRLQPAGASQKEAFPAGEPAA